MLSPHLQRGMPTSQTLSFLQCTTRSPLFGHLVLKMFFLLNLLAKLPFLMLFTLLNKPIKLSLLIMTRFGKYMDKISLKALLTMQNKLTKLLFLPLYSLLKLLDKLSLFTGTHSVKITGIISHKALFILLLSLISVPEIPLFALVTRHNGLQTGHPWTPPTSRSTHPLCPLPTPRHPS